MLTLKLTRPIKTASIVSDINAAHAHTPPLAPGEAQATSEGMRAALQAERMRLQAEIEQQKNGLAQLCQAINRVLENLNGLYQETLAANRTNIAKLAVEIAGKILMVKVRKGNYDIQAIVEEALKRAPTRQNLVIRLNPEDLPRCQQLQQENADSPFADLEFTADWSIGRSECLVETPKGIVKSFIEEHLERIGEALQKVE